MHKSLRHCDSGYTMILVCHAILQDRLSIWSCDVMNRSLLQSFMAIGIMVVEICFLFFHVRSPDSRFMWLCGQNPLMVSHPCPVWCKVSHRHCGGHRHCGRREKMFLICHMILQDHVTKGYTKGGGTWLKAAQS